MSAGPANTLPPSSSSTATLGGVSVVTGANGRAGGKPDVVVGLGGAASLAISYHL